ncbi:ras guanine nucleotide exchange factor V isoform X1 [Drosophila pseudoobscura]|uniref:Ras guanine nucleotide exchange factor V isoform X1 n=1 Tax=Drosophila pseudoobscura pseudoobscura TaxID=46245 RepID=A0A6I8WEJ3_DROPS|nr:ras guanine nucleotide exchange factor V isoform X1 [Drosophila pseudoobscura]XP_033240988.1 ras guanine nucleotide exchange factor V isoform X1 [Drosophila pseudoobscura]XP_033240989.1 ras guanine nucleotide exchange factor V isoform X1 [Drosophila pseudoobscura]
MLSSLATFLFGAPATSESSSNNEVNPAQASDPCDTAIEQAPSPGDVIEVTSSTPSVAGNSSRGPVRASPNGKSRGKNRRGKQRYNQQQQQQQQQQRKQQTATITKLLTPTGETPIEEDFDEDEWYIVEKEDEEDDSLPRSDSEEELSVVEVQQQPKAATSSSSSGHGQAVSGSSRHRRQHINSHSLYSGPRPQQQRNHLQRSRVARPLSISTLSPPRSVPPSSLADLDNVSQSLYVASPSGSDHGQGQGQGQGQGANVLMEESWYVTPPPCFTSIGPINMETSPFENLLIEHPSMSVYRSIRSTQEGTESFVNLDLGVAAEAPQSELAQQEAAEPEQAQAQALHEQRPHSARFDRHAAAQLKQETLARQSQKSNNKKQHQQLCRSAIKRSNKVRDFQAKSHRPRRSEMQHCKLVSGANNNRKCCF